MENQTAIERAIRAAGGCTALAMLLNVHKSLPSQWARRHRPIPAERCPDIERFTGVPCEELRPDLAEQWEYLRTSRNLLPADGAQNLKERAA